MRTTIFKNNKKKKWKNDLGGGRKKCEEEKEEREEQKRREEWIKIKEGQGKKDLSLEKKRMSSKTREIKKKKCWNQKGRGSKINEKKILGKERSENTKT